MDLLITSAGDITSDLLCEKIGRNVLRVNLERSRDYNFEINNSGFKIEDHFGRYVDNKNLGKIIWRKPLNDLSSKEGEQWFAFREFRYAIRAIVNQIAMERPNAVTINPFKFEVIDKFRQLKIARDLFEVASWTMTNRPDSVKLDAPLVVKSLSGSPIPGTGNPPKVLFTTEIQIEQLDEGWPWFIQSKIDANLDVTVVHVDNKNFAFCLDRKSFPGLDWRPHIGSEGKWEIFELPLRYENKINEFMKRLDLRYGRLDFLNNLEGDLIFLEVNPNGQWAWLDIEQKNGLFDAMINFLFTNSDSKT